MSAGAKKAVATVAAEREEKIVRFDPVELRAPFLLRCGAMLMDYLPLVAIPVLSLLAQKFFGEEVGKPLSGGIGSTAWIFAILFALTNFILLPMFNGQTIGKAIAGLQIVRKDGRSLTFREILLRHTLGYLLTGLTLGLGFMISVMGSRGRALHDYIAGTQVIYGRRRFTTETQRHRDIKGMFR